MQHYDLEVPRRDMLQYIEVFYNRQRLHSKPGYQSPMQFERAVLSAWSTCPKFGRHSNVALRQIMIEQDSPEESAGALGNMRAAAYSTILLGAATTAGFQLLLAEIWI